MLPLADKCAAARPALPEWALPTSLSAAMADTKRLGNLGARFPGAVVGCHRLVPVPRAPPPGESVLDLLAFGVRRKRAGLDRLGACTA